MEEQEFKQIAAYIPYGLRVYYDGLCEDDIKGEFTVSAYHVGSGINLMGDQELEYGDLSKFFYVDFDFPIKPILRHLSSMTKKEAYDLLCLIVGIEDIGFEQSDLDYISLNYEYDMLKIKGEFPFDDYVCGTKYTINISNDGVACFDTGSNGVYISHSAYNYLFSKHFDVFGLIDEGLAIEKNVVGL